MLVGEMKIMQIPVRFYPSVGGVENYVYHLSKELVKLKQDVTVLCANEPKAKKEEIMDGIKVKRLNYLGKIANTNITLKLPIEMVKEDFDIIHTHLPTPWSADWSAIIAKITNKPLVLTYHNDIAGNGFANYIAKFYNATMLKLLLSKADVIIITHTGYYDYSPFLKPYKDKIDVIPIGVDIERFKPSKTEKGGPVLFFLSVLDKFHRYKGLDYLLKALTIVKEEISDVKLIVGGDGELSYYYRGMADSLDLKANVDFTGFVSTEQIVDCYNNCNAFVLPSISAQQEGFGIVLLEAMACGKPVIATDIVGIAKETKERNAGKIVIPKDVKELSNAIIEILQDKKVAQEMGMNGRRLVEERYSWEKIAKRINGVYKRTEK
jgi:glycosyltransferase involved in cell wall biosynthesis